jgi:hypothetical protein
MKDGKVFAGGLVQEAADEVIIRDPSNQMVKVPKAQIASRQMSPASMMPPGLTASLREDEFVDLVRFLSELGREGNYKIKPNRFVRTWRVMGGMEKEVIDHVRHVGLQALHEKDGKYPWLPLFSQVSGEVPLAEMQEIKMYPWFPKILQFSLKMDSPGKVKLGLSSAKSINLVVGETALHEVTPEMTLDLPAGDLAAFRIEILEGAAQVTGF